MWVDTEIMLEDARALAYSAADDYRIPKPIREAIRSERPLDEKQHALLRDWARRELLENRLLRYLERARAPQGKSLRKLSLFTSFHGESMLGHADQIAMSLMAEDVAFFSPGHGSPGGSDHVVRVFGDQLEGGRTNRFRLHIDADGLGKLFAELPGTRSARLIFYASCSAGLDGEGGAPANGRRMAQFSGRAVVAPRGEITSVPTSDGRLKIAVTGRSESDAFILYEPDGTSRVIGFDEFRALVFRSGSARDKVSYLSR